MEKTIEKNSTIEDRSIVLTRILNAPRELVYEVWTKPEHVATWWGPNGFTNTVQEMDVRPGGVWRIMMHGPDGTDYPNKIVYKEVVKPERLVYTHSSDDENDPNAFEVVVTFKELGDKTELTMSSVFASKESRDYLVKEFGAQEGGNQTLKRLAAMVENMPTERKSPHKEFVLSRVFDAPQKLMFEVITQAKHLAHWWGPKGLDLEVSKLELRPGGIFLYSVHMPDGGKMWGKFIYREITAPERLVFVNSFSDEDGNTTRAPFAAGWPLEVLNILSLSEKEGKTRMELRSLPINATEEEHTMFEQNFENMGDGFAGTYDKLTDYLNTIEK